MNTTTVRAVTPPSRSLEQRLAALQKGNAVRSRRAQFKRDLKAGRVSVLELITTPPGWAETMKLADLLIATPKIGRVKLRKLLLGCQVAPSKTLGGLSGRQRRELVIALTGVQVVRSPQACRLEQGALRSRRDAYAGGEVK